MLHPDLECHSPCQCLHICLICGTYSISNKLNFQNATPKCETVIFQVHTDHKLYFPTQRLTYELSFKEIDIGSLLNLWEC